MAKIKIILTDDHKIVRDGIRAMLIGNPDIEIIAEASSGKELNECLPKLSPNVLVLDIGLPDVSGIELIPYILKGSASIKILVLSANCSEEIITSCIKAGAHGFLHKDSSKEEFIEAIKAVHEDEGYFSENISRLIYKSYINKIKENNPESKSLSEREKEIIRLFSDGLSFKEIGERLFISPRTVESHKNNILEKLELRNTIELVKYAFKSGIISI